jgi:hypothetical protein
VAQHVISELFFSMASEGFGQVMMKFTT